MSTDEYLHCSKCHQVLDIDDIIVFEMFQDKMILRRENEAEEE